MAGEQKFYFNNQERPKPYISYCDGPNIPRPTGLFSGEYYSGRYAIWINNNGAIIKKPLQNYNEVVIRNFTGTILDYIPGIINENSHTFFSNLTSCFDNKSQPVLGLMDNRSSPKILVVYNTGLTTATWSGYNPVVYNTLNVNYPLRSPSPLYPTFQTGVIACYYTDILGINLFGRYSFDNFTTEYPINSGLNTGALPAFAISSPEPSGPPYYSNLKRIIAFDPMGNITAYTSPYTINFCFDDFDKYGYTGITIDVLTGGYGRWARETTFHYSSGNFALIDEYFSDSLQSYNSGQIILLSASISNLKFYPGDNKIYTFIGLTEGLFQSSNTFVSDGFETYPTGTKYTNYTGVISGVPTVFGRVYQSGEF